MKNIVVLQFVPELLELPTNKRRAISEPARTPQNSRRVPREKGARKLSIIDRNSLEPDYGLRGKTFLSMRSTLKRI